MKCANDKYIIEDYIMILENYLLWQYGDLYSYFPEGTFLHLSMSLKSFIYDYLLYV